MAGKEKTDKISNVKTLIKLVQGDKENKTPGAISALGSKYRDLQRKIDNAVALSRSRAQERKRAKEEELEKDISENMSDKWKIERISRVSLAILKLAIFEVNPKYSL